MTNTFFLDDNYKTSSTEIKKKTSADISLRSKDKTFYEMLSSLKVEISAEATEFYRFNEEINDYFIVQALFQNLSLQNYILNV